MQTSNTNQESRSNDLEWYLLGEYSLSKFLSSHEKRGELTAALLSQTMRDLGIPQEYLENIDRALTGYAKEALEHFKQGGLELPGRIRVFCQKKMVAAANSEKISRLYNSEQAQNIHPPSTIMNGGWGYFIIERSADNASPSERFHPYIDLYLYKEGE